MKSTKAYAPYALTPVMVLQEESCPTPIERVLIRGSDLVLTDTILKELHEIDMNLDTIIIDEDQSSRKEPAFDPYEFEDWDTCTIGTPSIDIAFAGSTPDPEEEYQKVVSPCLTYTVSTAMSSNLSMSISGFSMYSSVIMDELQGFPPPSPPHSEARTDCEPPAAKRKSKITRQFGKLKSFFVRNFGCCCKGSSSPTLE